MEEHTKTILDDENSDLFIRLSNHGQITTIDKILGLLKYQDLKNFGQVSLEWKDLIGLYEHYWKKILDRNIKNFPGWSEAHNLLFSKHSEWISKLGDDGPVNRLTFEAVHSLLNEVKNNYMKGSKGMKVKKMLCESNIALSRSFLQRVSYPNYPYMEMNKQYLVRGLMTDGGIYVMNRWTLKLLHMFENPFKESSDQRVPDLLGLQLNNEFVVANYSNKAICAWHLETKQMVWKRIPGANEVSLKNYYHRKMRLSDNGLLLYCIETALPVESKETSVVNDFFLLDVKDSSAILQEGDRVFNYTSKAQVAKEFFFCGTVIVIINGCHCTVADWSTRTTLKKFDLATMPTSNNPYVDNFKHPSHHIFSTSTGIFLIASNTVLTSNIIRFWKLTGSENGAENVGSLVDSKKILSAKCVGEKFIITLSIESIVKIWDFQHVLCNGPENPVTQCLQIEKKKSLYCCVPDDRRIIPLGQIESWFGGKLVADDYQIAIAFQTTRLLSFSAFDRIHVLDFMDNTQVLPEVK